MQPNLREAVPDRPKQAFIPLNLELGVQSALHQNPGATKVDGLLDLVEDDFDRQDIALGVVQRTLERTEAAVFGTNIGVVDVAVDNISDHALRVQLATNRVSRHSNADQVIALKQIQSLRAS